MIDQDDVEKLRCLADGASLCPPPPEVLRELCRVYLAWLEALEVDVEPDMDTGGETGAIWLEQEMIGKRVRLVEVKE